MYSSTKEIFSTRVNNHIAKTTTSLLYQPWVQDIHFVRTYSVASCEIIFIMEKMQRGHDIKISVQ